MTAARVYVAGPMTGLPGFNYSAFNRAAAWLRAQGLHVENPAENKAPVDAEWIDWMRLAISQLIKCDAIILLNGWQQSRGATVEYERAKGLGLWIYSMVESDDRDPYLVVLRAGDNPRRGRFG